MLHYAFLVLSVASAVWGSLQLMTHWWQLWIPAGLYLLTYLSLMVAFTLLSIVFSFTFNRRKTVHPYRPFVHHMMCGTIEAICMWCRVKIRFENRKLIPQGPSLVVSNHVSRFDPMITFMELWNRRMTFVSKPENFKIPVAGHYMARNNFIAIDRHNNRRAKDSVERAVEMIRDEDYTVGIYPEGTRNHEQKLLPFKPGSFKIAVETGVPVVVMSVKGTDQIQKRAPWRRTKVLFRVLDVLQPSDFENTIALAERASQIISADLFT